MGGRNINCRNTNGLFQQRHDVAAPRGHIGLHDHGDQAALRNINIRDIKN